MSTEHWWCDTDGENFNNWRKAYPSATLSTTDSTWTELELNPSLCWHRPVTYCLTHFTSLNGS